MPDRIADPWGPRTPYGRPARAERIAARLPAPVRARLPSGLRGHAWPVRVDKYLEPGVTEADVDRWVQSASVLHSNGDAFDVAVKDGRIVGVRGRAVDRVNHGRLDPKDLFGWQANASPDRLTAPLVREGDSLVESDWDTAMGRIVDRSRALLDGPRRLGSPRLLHERPAVPRGVLHAGCHREGRHRHAPHGRQHPALHRHVGRRAQGELRHGQPGSYTDVDHCDALALWGHNVAETQTVLWMRMLDRLCGPDPPALLVVDPRPTPPAREADLHVAVRNGTNQALMNGIIHLLFTHGWIDERYVRRHVIGADRLEQVAAGYAPERVAEICDVPAAQVEAAAELVGTCDRLLSTVLHGFYQSHQATAAACQVNNIHLLRGMLGRPGAGVYQMNGQPTAQNTRETGADGDLPGMRNWSNAEHIRQLAGLWNVDQMTIPHWAEPTHAMQIFRYAEQGSIKLLWISATNPAVSMPALARVRRILEQEDLFVVVQDIRIRRCRRGGRRPRRVRARRHRSTGPDQWRSPGRGVRALPLRILGPRPGQRSCGGDGHPARAVNELTITEWDPVSKQPRFKVTAVRVTKVAAGGGRPSPAPTVGAPAPLDPATVPPTVGGPDADATAALEA